MKKSNKVLSAVAAGVLGVMGIAYAAVVTTHDLLVVDGGDNSYAYVVVGEEEDTPGVIYLRGGIGVGAAGRPGGTIQFSGGLDTEPNPDVKYTSFKLSNYNDVFGLTTNDDTVVYPIVRVFNEAGTDNDLNLSVEGDVRVESGGVIFTQDNDVSSDYANINSNADGDIVIQLGS